MNLKQLQFVAHVAKTHSFSRAAELSFATQPTLSNAISQLEEELGGRLFNRTTRKVELTPFGEYILPQILEVLQSRDELLKSAESYHNPAHKILRIGFSPLVDMQRLNQVLAPFRQAYPEITLFFKECFIDDLSTRLSKEQIDIQIVPSSETQEGEASCRFYQDNLYYLPALDDEHAANRLAFKISDLPQTPIILTGGGCGLNNALTELLKSQGVTLQPYPGQAMTYKVIEDWASLGIGAGILPKAKISPDNKAVYPLFIKKNQPAYFSYEWIWRSDRAIPEHIATFLDYIQTTVPTLIEGQAESSTLRNIQRQV
ncbi:MAG: LysR family transcriptional regulator [Chromatiales bacterium]|nr:LysR family transcriptional regulator [Chromatiales bacterium]